MEDVWMTKEQLRYFGGNQTPSIVYYPRDRVLGTLYIHKFNWNHHYQIHNFHDESWDDEQETMDWNVLYGQITNGGQKLEGNKYKKRHTQEGQTTKDEPTPKDNEQT